MVYEDYDEFIENCVYGNLDLAKKIFFYGSSIDIINKAFRCACKNGQFKVAKWLYSLGNVEIHAENDYCFSLCL